MLNFLRKYQRYFFFVITGVVIVSFCFFGTYSSMGQPDAIPDKEIGRGVCGKPLMQHELAALTALIENSPFDYSSQEKGGMPNFFNDGVVEKDFLSTGLGVILAKRYFDELKFDLDQRVKKIHQFRPYSHPRTSQVSAEGAWARYTPALLEKFRMLKAKSDQPTVENFAIMCQLYVDQAMVPPDVLRQILTMQQNQLGIAPDPQLAHSDLSLFGFKSMGDWFGPRFVSLVAQFILNSAQIAEEKGYEVKIEEVRADLFQNIYSGYQHIARDSKLSSEEVERYYQTKMRMLGFDEPRLINTWKKVILFRRLFNDGSESVLIDPLAYKQFNQFAKENVRVALYQLPNFLQFSDFRSMLKFQCYLEGISPDTSRLRTDLRLPRQIAAIEHMERKIPELVERQIELEWSAISKEDLCRAISVKETWDWETSDVHWELLKKNFSEVANIKEDAPPARLSSLNRLDEKVRGKIDQFARQKMVEEQPAKIKLALDLASTQTSFVGLKLRGTAFPIPGIKETPELVALLENASLKGEASNVASEKLSFYSAGGEHFYRIQVLQRNQNKKILTFAEASTDGTLDRLLDKKLEEAYPEMRKKDAKYFQLSNGEWKPFKEVKDQIGRHLFADLLKSIEESYRAHFGFLPGKEGDLPLNFYSNARLFSFMQEAQKALKANPADPAWLKSEGTEQSLAEQWLLESKEKTIERCTEVPFSKDEMFTLGSGEWSSVKVGERGALAFYIIQEKGSSHAAPLLNVEQGHQILSFDAKRDMMLQILQKIQQKKAIDVSSMIAEESR